MNYMILSRLLSRNGFNLYGTNGTAEYYSDLGILILISL